VDDGSDAWRSAEVQNRGRRTRVDASDGVDAMQAADRDGHTDLHADHDAVRVVIAAVTRLRVQRLTPL
jgi:hypothetical protein